MIIIMIMKIIMMIIMIMWFLINTLYFHWNTARYFNDCSLCCTYLQI